VSAVARAHEVLHEVRPGGAVALRAYESDGEPLANVPYEVWSPADGKGPWQEGRTDRAGWLSFVPEVPGSWRVKVVEAGGHGLEVVVDTAALAPPAPAPTPATGPATSPAPPQASAAGPGAAFVLRPLLGVLLVGALFGGLVLLYRRKPRR
jgi:nickel transport protein